LTILRKPSPDNMRLFGGSRAKAVFSAAVLLLIAAAGTKGARAACETDCVAEPFPSMYAESDIFREAIADAETSSRPPRKLSGVTVPHHLLVADLIARGMGEVDRHGIDRIVILSPDHFKKTRRPFATTRRDFETLFGLVRTDRAATETLLRSELVDYPDNQIATDNLPAEFCLARARLTILSQGRSRHRKDCGADHRRQQFRPRMRRSLHGSSPPNNLQVITSPAWNLLLHCTRASQKTSRWTCLVSPLNAFVSVVSAHNHTSNVCRTFPFGRATANTEEESQDCNDRPHHRGDGR